MPNGAGTGKSKSKTAFVAGATGFTGNEVVRKLREMGLEVIAHVRPESHSLELWRGRFYDLGAKVDTTAWVEEEMAKTLSDVNPNLVFALLGTTRERINGVKAKGGDPASVDYDAVDYGLTAMLLHAAQNTMNIPRFVYLSAVGVKENPSSAYYKARWKLESELKESGLPYVIARPSFIVGEREAPRPMETFGAKISDGALRFAGALGFKDIRDRYLSITNKQLAAALVHLALSPESEDVVVETEGLHGAYKRSGIFDNKI